ncbi:MAG: hypothetical protein A2X67_14610 [Ignavibacteria bacterium GWA2_55_11]|nr:MAG: hypothetical protein A2X67_14610 [Ignavibacteria bacterium GWA2_55_11]
MAGRIAPNEPADNVNSEEPLVPSEDEARKLSAVMFTDIKGFSAKMSQNEAGAFDLLKKHDALLRVLATKYNGKVIKSIGDSFMIDFPSAVNAVKCAVEAQKKFHSYNSGKIEFDRIEIRIGVHLGDVLIRGEDIFGDGVNIASRIESITAPTRICISQEVYSQIRNRMPVQTFRIGAITLKNIPEPVEVYEVLIDEIPDFAKPSPDAMERSKKQKVEFSQRETVDEEREARHVEQAKQRAASSGPMSEEERARRIADHYARAEKYYELGHITEAESELKRIEELDPGFQPSTERRQEEEEKENKAQTHLRKARELIAQGNFKEAEQETNKVFEYYPLHVGAQQVLLRIEEERYRREEEERSKRIEHDKEQHTKTAEQVQLETLMQKSRTQLEASEFQEAIFTLRDVFVIDPNNFAARELEEEIKRRQESKVEDDKRLQQEREQREHEERLAAAQRRQEELQAARPVVEQARPRKPFPTKQVLTVVGLLAVGGLLYTVIPAIWKALFPTTMSVAVLQFDAGSENVVASALPLLLVDDLSQMQHVTVRSFATSSRYDNQPANFDALAGVLGVRYLLTGEVAANGDQYDVKMRVYDTHQREQVLAWKSSAPITGFARLRQQMLATIINEVGLDADIPPVAQPTTDAWACTAYLEAFALLEKDGRDDLTRARDLMLAVEDSGKGFPLSRAALGEAMARLSRLGGSDDAGLGIAQNAAKDAPNNPYVLRSLAVAHMAENSFEQAMVTLNKSLELLPVQAEPHRMLAEIWLIAGNTDEGAAELDAGAALDPGNPRTLFLQGLFAHMKDDKVEAARLYEAAISAGGNRAYITWYFLASAWLRGTKRDAAVDYYSSFVASRPGDYRYLYLLGRAYAEKLDSAQLYFDRGLEVTRTILDRNRDDVDARIYRALFLTRLGQFDNARNEVDRVVQSGSLTSSVRFRVANIYSLQRERDAGLKAEAIKALKEALADRYDFSEILNPDFGSLAVDAAFRAAIVRPLRIQEQ